MDARLRSVEEGVLGLSRIGDVEGWQIPGRYLEVLRGASPALLVEIVHHNDLDVRSLANLLAHAADHLAAGSPGRASAPAGDLAGLARAFRRDRRPLEALACLDVAVAIAEDRDRGAPSPVPDPIATEPWWSPARVADFGGRAISSRARTMEDASPWTFARIATERARLLRALDRPEDAIESWLAAAAAGGRLGILAWTEIAKVREHRLRDLDGALEATIRASRALERRRSLGRPEPGLERAVAHRAARLRRRRLRAAARDQTSGRWRTLAAS